MRDKNNGTTGNTPANPYMPDSGTSSPSRYLPTGTSIPGSHEILAQQVLALKKPTATVIFSGEGVAIDQLVAPADALLVQAFPGGSGGRAVAESILGQHNRFGRLSSSWMSKRFEDEQYFSDFAFAAQGRTYKYGNRGGALFEFGDGLSFSDHALTVVPVAAVHAPTAADSAEAIGCSLSYAIKVTTLSGARGGDVVVLAFLVPKTIAIGQLQPGTPLPARQLAAARRLRKDDQTGSVSAVLTLDAEAVKLTSIDGSRALRAGKIYLLKDLT